MPEVPVVAETPGFKGFDMVAWTGLFAPAHTPPAVVDKLNAEINRIVQSAEMKEFFLREGAEPAPLKPAEFGQLIAAEIARWKKVAQAANIQPE